MLLECELPMLLICATLDFLVVCATDTISLQHNHLFPKNSYSPHSFRKESSVLNLLCSIMDTATSHLVNGLSPYLVLCPGKNLI